MEINWIAILDWLLKGFSNATGWLAAFFLCVLMLKFFIIHKPWKGKCLLCHRDLDEKTDTICKISLDGETTKLCEDCCVTLLQIKIGKKKIEGMGEDYV